VLPLERVGRVRDRPTGHAASLRGLIRGRALKRPEGAKPAADPRARISVVSGWAGVA